MKSIGTAAIRTRPEPELYMLPSPYAGLTSAQSSRTSFGEYCEVPETSNDGIREEERRPHHPLYLVILTITLGGLQVVWTTIMSQGSPFLSSLGLSNALISLVWLAGPLSGALVQPYIGVRSDACTHRWGRRKPFIVYGALATIVCLLSLPRTTESVRIISSPFSIDPNGRLGRFLAKFLAAAWIWALNISIQPVQGGIRTLIVDVCPPSEQVRANAYASCMVGVGSLLGYTTAFLDLPKLLPIFGETQFQSLSSIASIALGSTIVLNSMIIKERRNYTGLESLENRKSSVQILRKIIFSMRTLPKKIKRIFLAQFFAWLGWFPFLFYITTYIASIYQDTIVHSTNTSIFNNVSELIESNAVRHGTFSLLIFAATAFLTNLILPYFISEQCPSTILADRVPDDTAQLTPEDDVHSSERDLFLSHKHDAWAPKKRTGFMIPGLTLTRAWMVSHTLRSVVLLCTVFTTKLIPSVFLIALLGMSWALTQWAPFALINAEIAKSRTMDRACSDLRAPLDSDHASFEQSVHDEEKGVDAASMSVGQMELQAGTIIGLQNMAIATPQMIAAVVSSMIFWVLGGWGIVGGEAIGWVMRVGGVTGFFAAWVVWGIED